MKVTKFICIILCQLILPFIVCLICEFFNVDSFNKGYYAGYLVGVLTTVFIIKGD